MDEHAGFLATNMQIVPNDSLKRSALQAELEAELEGVSQWHWQARQPSTLPRRKVPPPWHDPGVSKVTRDMD